MWHAQRNVIVPYLVLCQLLFVKASQRCRTEYSINGMMLQRHTFKKIKTTSWPECVKACNNDVRCQSTNYVINEAICELNNCTKKAKPEDFVADKDRTYMTRLSQIVPLGSTAELPAESCAEIKASEGENVVSGIYWFDSIKPGIVSQAPCSMSTEECIHYQALTNGDRKQTNGNQPLLCDNLLGPAWFRFLGDAGSKMSASCVPPHRCGTHAPGWLNGAHPTVAEGRVTRQVCFSWSGSCCFWSINIMVRNCDGYFVYFIRGTPPRQRCHLRYCSTD